MTIHLSLSQWGLVSDIIGVVLLFIYGLPSKMITVRQTLLAVGDFSNEQNKEANRINRKIRTVANIGLGFILIGFVLQFAGGFN